VREPAAETTSTIVVGVDGSDGARRALEWAADEARLRDARLLAIHTWHIPPLTTGVGPLDPPMTLDADTLARLESAANELLESEVAAVDTSGVEVERQVEASNPADALLAAASDADLLVVGSRGRGGFRGLLLGSVSQQVSQHAPCPVVIVPRPD
jgi:nucleotide-binding universal stress UspA family protein